MIVRFLILLILVALLPLMSHGQVGTLNLAPNGGFEDGNNSPRGFFYSRNGATGTVSRSNFNSDIKNWEALGHSPDWIDVTAADLEDFPPGSSSFDVNSTDQNGNFITVSCKFDMQSSRAVRIGGTEGVGVELKSTLITGKKYVFRINTLSNTNSDVLNIHLSDRKDFDAGSASTQNNVAVVTRSSALGLECFQVFEQVITVTKNDMNWLIIMAATGAVIIDDVELFEFCPDLIEEKDKFYHVPSRTLEAKEIYAGDFSNPPSSQFKVIVKAGAGLTTYKAEKEIVLKSGFVADNGTHFHAFIAPCGSKCPQAKVSNSIANVAPVYRIVLCSDDILSGYCSTLGASKVHGMSYAWSSNNSSNLSYLSSTSSYPVKFCPPTTLSGSGLIKFTVTATNACNETAEEEYYFYYDMNNENQTSMLNTYSTFRNSGSPIEVEFGFNHTTDLYKVIFRAYEENDANKTTIISQVFWFGDDFENDTYTRLKLQEPLINQLDRGSGKNYCFELKCFFMCESISRDHTECTNQGW